MSWIAAAGLAIGAGTSLYGAKKQEKANKSAQAQNAAQQDEQNRLAWANYLMQRGIDPSGAQTGVIPQNAKAVNTRMPLWATGNFARPGARKTWRRKGTTPAAGTLSIP